MQESNKDSEKQREISAHGMHSNVIATESVGAYSGTGNIERQQKIVSIETQPKIESLNQIQNPHIMYSATTMNTEMQINNFPNQITMEAPKLPNAVRSKEPGEFICPQCNRRGLSIVQNKTGKGSWTLCCGLFFLGLW